MPGVGFAIPTPGIYMIEKFEKGKKYPVSPSFVSTEFDCRCKLPTCTFTYIDSDLVLWLETLRKHVGALRISSAYRCSAHNNLVGGKPGSMHLVGKAADVSSPKAKPSEIAAYAEVLDGFKSGGIGRYLTFVHLDVRGYKARWDGRPPLVLKQMDEAED